MRIVRERFGGVVSFVDYKDKQGYCGNENTEDVMESGKGNTETTNHPSSLRRHSAPNNPENNALNHRPLPLREQQRSKGTVYTDKFFLGQTTTIGSVLALQGETHVQK